ncbi:MAG: Ig-like domain-containing protein [Pseudanabaena sp. ELA607]|jgi:Tol biopolymer transport system component
MGSSSRWFSLPLDRWATAISCILAIVMVILLWIGDRTAPQVREFSWQNQTIDAGDKAFLLTFSRPMNQTSVEENLKIEPPLPGKTSWSGRRMAYTLIEPVVYGTRYTVSLENAFDRFTKEVGQKAPIAPFRSTFQTPLPRFAYIGATDAEKGRLVLYDVATKTHHLITPPELTVLDFRIYPDRRKILFSAITGEENRLNQKLYTVNIGIDAQEQITDNPSAPQVILDSNDYQNFKFDLSADGKIILVQRLSRSQAGRYGLWIIRENTSAQPLDNPPGGDFMITPDSASVAISQGEGVAILPLEKNAKPLDFLPRFGAVMDFSPSGSQAAMVKFSKDYTRSLYLVNNQGVQKELIKTNGSILSVQFSPNETMLYALLTDLDPTLFREKPYIAAIDLKTNTSKRLIELSGQRDINLAISPDGKFLVFNSTATNNPVPNSGADNNPNSTTDRESYTAGDAEAARRRTSRTNNTPPTMVILPLTEQPTPEVLSIRGSNPRWLF